MKIISHVQNAEWLIPNFQRNYDWKHEHVRELLTSIFMEYYVGSLLLWDPKNDDELDAIPVHGVKGNFKNPPHNQLIVLDGQQRITSLNYVISSPEFTKKEDKKRFPGYFYVDLQVYLENSDPDYLIKRSNKKLTEQETFDRFWFPLYHLHVTKIQKWINDFLDQLEGDDSQKLKIQKIGIIINAKLFRILSQFQIPYVILPKSIEFDSVATIFENLNSKGMPLGTFDLLNVRLSRHDVPLKKLWMDTLDEYEKIHEYFDDKPEIRKIGLYIVESMSLAFTQTKSCMRKDILNLFVENNYTVENFTNQWKIMSKFIQLSIEYIEDKNKYGILSRKDIPYESIIPILAGLMQEIKTNFKQKETICMEKISYWYWASVFDRRFTEGSGTKKTTDFNDLINWFKDDSSVPAFIKTFRENYRFSITLREIQKSNDSIYRGIFLLLNKNNADDFKQRIILAENKSQKDHIFPKSKFKKKDGLQNSIINMTYLSRETNSEKSNRIPSDYIPEIIEKVYAGDEMKFLKVLECHFIDKKCLEYLKNDDFENFINAREDLLYESIGNAIGAKT